MINDARFYRVYEGYSTWGAQNYTPQNVLDHLQREAFYGTAATQSVGTSPVDASLQFQPATRRPVSFPRVAGLLLCQVMRAPVGGPDQVLRVATNALHVINEVSTAEEARSSVQMMAGKGIKNVKIWVDGCSGSIPADDARSLQRDYR